MWVYGLQMYIKNLINIPGDCKILAVCRDLFVTLWPTFENFVYLCNRKQRNFLVLGMK